MLRLVRSIAGEIFVLGIRKKQEENQVHCADLLLTSYSVCCVLGFVEKTGNGEVVLVDSLAPVLEHTLPWGYGGVTTICLILKQV